MGTADFTTSSREEGDRVLVETTARPSSCTGGAPSTEMLVEIPLGERTGACPAGKKVLEYVAAGDRATWLPDAATLDATTRKEILGRLGSWRGQVDAYLVGCAPVRLAFVEGGERSSMPRWEPWTYEPARPQEVIAGDPAPSVEPPPATTQLGPPSCAAPPLEPGAVRWVGRDLSTGLEMVGPSWLETRIVDRTKTRDGETVRMTIYREKAIPENRDAAPSTNWTCVESSVTAGTMRRQGGTLRLTFAASGASEGSSWTCSLRNAPIAASETLRTKLPQLDESCKRSKWAKAGRNRQVMICVADHRGDFIVAPAPGVEHVTIDEDDCGDRTSALRAIAKDGNVRTVRRNAK